MLNFEVKAYINLVRLLRIHGRNKNKPQNVNAYSTTHVHCTVYTVYLHSMRPVLGRRHIHMCIVYSVKEGSVGVVYYTLFGAS